MHSSSEAPKQRSYPAYCDVTATGPGSNKITPYAQHSVTSYNNGQADHKHQPNFGVPQPKTKTFLLPKNSPQKITTMVNNKTLVKGQPTGNRRSLSQGNGAYSRDKMNAQYIDPPEEFQFTANHKIR